MDEKSKPSEMQRLRAAGFSLASAERLAQRKRRPDLFLICCFLVAMFLLGGVLVLIFIKFINPDIIAQRHILPLHISLVQAPIAEEQRL